MVRASSLFVLLILAVSVPGCAMTREARHIRTTGFLGDYSQLEKQKEGEVLLLYVEPEADFSGYDKLLLDDVTIWRNVDSDLSDISEDDLQKLALGLHRAVVENLNEDYRIVHTAGPGTLRVRIAITEAAESWVVMDTLTTVIPHTLLISGVQQMATGMRSFVERARVEGEILDSRSGERLAAALDRQAGGKSFQGMMSSWEDVEKAFEHWAKRLRDRMREERGEKEDADVAGE